MVMLDPAVKAVEDELHGLVQDHEVERILHLAASTPDGRAALTRLVQDSQGYRERQPKKRRRIRRMLRAWHSWYDAWEDAHNAWASAQRRADTLDTALAEAKDRIAVLEQEKRSAWRHAREMESDWAAERSRAETAENQGRRLEQTILTEHQRSPDGCCTTCAHERTEGRVGTFMLWPCPTAQAVTSNDPEPAQPPRCSHTGEPKVGKYGCGCHHCEP